MSALNKKAREAFKTKLEVTLARLLATGQFPTPETVAAEIAFDAEEFGLLAFKEGLEAAMGAAMGAAVFKDLSNTAGVSNADLVDGKLSRAAVSFMCCRVRRHLGFHLRAPANRRGGRKPKTP